MKITVEYRYWETEIPYRCRNARPVEHTATLTTTVREVSGDDAPVAIKQMGQYSIENQYRWYKGSLYFLEVYQADYRVNKYVPVKILPEYNLGADRFSDRNNYRKNANPYGDIQYEEYEQSKEQACLQILNHFKNYLIIDGVTHRKIGEPRYVIGTYGLGHNHGGTSIHIDKCYNSNISRDRYFSLLDRELCVKTAIEIAARRGDTNDISDMGVISDDCEILIPEAIKLNPKKEHGTGCAFINKIESLTESGMEPNVVGVLGMLLVASGGGF